MRHALALALAVLSSCGSSSDRPPLFGGFTPADATAVVFPATTCDIPIVGVTSISGLAILEGSFDGACEFITASRFCDRKADATLVLSVAVRGVTGGGTAPALGPGTYPYLAAPPTSATFAAAIASAAKTDDACSALPGTATSMDAGQIVVSSITADRATGSLDLRFDDGSSRGGSFDLPLCPPPADLCALLTGAGCGVRACLP